MSGDIPGRLIWAGIARHMLLFNPDGQKYLPSGSRTNIYKYQGTYEIKGYVSRLEMLLFSYVLFSVWLFSYNGLLAKVPTLARAWLLL